MLQWYNYNYFRFYLIYKILNSVFINQINKCPLLIVIEDACKGGGN